MKRRILFCLTALLSLLLFNAFGLAATPYTYNWDESRILHLPLESNHKTNISSYLETYVDSSGNLTIQDFLNPANKFIFKPNTDRYTPRHENKTIWARLQVENVSSLNNEWKLIPHHASTTEYFIANSDANKHYLLSDMYYYSPNGEINSQQTGSEIPMNERTESALSPVVSFSLRKGESATIYLKITTGSKESSTGKILLDISPAQEFEQAEKIEFAFQSMFGSVMLFTTLFALILFFAIRDKSMLFLACISFFALLYCWEASGMNKMVLFRNGSVYFLAFMSVINQAGGFISGYFFYTSILPMKEEAPRLRKIFATLTFLQCLMALFRFLTQNNLLPLDVLHFAAILWFICMLTVVVYFLIKKNRQAKFLVFATTLLVVCAVLTGLALEHIVPDIFQRAFQTGMVVYIILLGVGAIDKVRQIRIEKEKLIQMN